MIEGNGVYRIHRATSPNGVHWKRHGAVNLGWSTGREINPAVISEADGSLTMTYHRLSGASYIARSTDGGATWDTRMTQVSDGVAALPRVSKRDSVGLYVVTYQVNPGSFNLELHSKASYDPYDWSGAASVVSSGANSHDSQPHPILQGTPGYVSLFWSSQDGERPYVDHDIWMMRDLPIHHD